MEQFEDLEKEDIIKLFVSSEFNPMLEYYQKSYDLNASYLQEIEKEVIEMLVGKEVEIEIETMRTNNVFTLTKVKKVA